MATFATCKTERPGFDIGTLCAKTAVVTKYKFSVRCRWVGVDGLAVSWSAIPGMTVPVTGHAKPVVRLDRHRITRTLVRGSSREPPIRGVADIVFASRYFKPKVVFVRSGVCYTELFRKFDSNTVCETTHSGKAASEIALFLSARLWRR